MKMFPIMDGPSVPWEAMAPHEGQANLNHYQTLARLAERGGLACGEAWMVVNGRGYKGTPQTPEWWAEMKLKWIAYAERINLHFDELEKLRAERDALKADMGPLRDIAIELAEQMDWLGTGSDSDFAELQKQGCLERIRRAAARSAAERQEGR